jgi:excinuclease ABC subunit C
MKARLAGRVSAIECWATGSKLESSLLLYEVAKGLFPKDYVRRLRLRMPWFLAVVDENEFPRLAVLNRISRRSSLQVGPFPTRELAQLYQEEVLGLFHMRRCTERLAPAPDHPGCIYGEMNQCLRPCQCAVSASQYAAESARVGNFLKSNGRSETNELSVLRDQANASLNFETALALHKRMERVRTTSAARGELVSALEDLNGIAVTRSTEERKLLLWPMREGCWQEPLPVDLSPDEPQAKSLDAELREKLTHAFIERSSKDNRLEHLALLLRWHRSSSRDGDWFPFRSKEEPNYRRLVRAISRLAKAEAISR